MSLERAIEHGKEHRKPYYRSARFDRSCRPHGGCPYCLRNREYGKVKREFDAEEQIREARRG